MGYPALGSASQTAVSAFNTTGLVKLKAVHTMARFQPNMLICTSALARRATTPLKECVFSHRVKALSIGRDNNLVAATAFARIQRLIGVVQHGIEVIITPCRGEQGYRRGHLA